MGEKYLGKLLEELDDAYPAPLKVEVLLKQKQIPPDVILDAIKGELIRTQKRPDEEYDIPFRMPCYLSAKGFEYLNQIRMKETLQQLDPIFRTLFKK